MKNRKINDFVPLHHGGSSERGASMISGSRAIAEKSNRNSITYYLRRSNKPSKGSRRPCSRLPDAGKPLSSCEVSAVCRSLLKSLNLSEDHKIHLSTRRFASKDVAHGTRRFSRSIKKNAFKLEVETCI